MGGMNMYCFSLIAYFFCFLFDYMSGGSWGALSVWGASRSDWTEAIKELVPAARSNTWDLQLLSYFGHSCAAPIPEDQYHTAWLVNTLILKLWGSVTYSQGAIIICQKLYETMNNPLFWFLRHKQSRHCALWKPEASLQPAGHSSRERPVWDQQQHLRNTLHRSRYAFSHIWSVNVLWNLY